ncbi:SPOR domain-containing protein [Puniceibacterium sediminis]|uniref:Sporulation related domain-containing protein n=1 Tax=Puniceibacterium sediminis TaxID=1608407 RepID=A0A238XJR6_9RHOB|nr:SPOR domain-containing protein [Puniceibacterium sediminis]SNR58821.1 Sporulation related domain-containing protein [Puniceibacterium sediminis]
MADFTYSGPSARARTRPSFTMLTNWAGAAISLGLLVGVGVWGTRVVMRDVSGVPIVQASEGPMRIAPEDPGGESADHQGLSVNDVAGNGIAADPADRLILAPRPITLSDEDVAPGIAVAPDPDRPRVADTSARLGEDPTETGGNLVESLANQIADGNAPLVGAAMAGTMPEPMTADDEQSDTGATVADESSEEDTFDNAIDSAIGDALAQAIPEAIAGLARSLRPKLRPVGLQQTASLAPMAPVVHTTKDIDPDSLPVGTRLAQLGAFDSAETALSEWTRLEARFGDYMDGKDRVIQRATSGGRVFYRLRVHGFTDLSDARRFCSAFVSENADCIPVVTR